MKVHNRLIILLFLSIVIFVHFTYYSKKHKFTKRIDYTVQSSLSENALERVAVVFPSFESPYDSLAKGIEYSNQIDKEDRHRIIFFNFNFNDNCSEEKLKKEASEIAKNIKAINIKKVIFLGDITSTYLDPKLFEESYFIGVNPNYINRINAPSNEFYKTFIIDSGKEQKMKELNTIRQMFKDNFINTDIVSIITESSSYRLASENNMLEDMRKFYSTMGFTVEEYEISSSDDVLRIVEDFNEARERRIIIVIAKRFSNLKNNSIGFRKDILKMIYDHNTKNLIFSSYYSDVKKGICQISLGLNYFDLGANVYKLIKGDDSSILQTPYVFTLSIRGFNKINLRKIYKNNKNFIQFIGEENGKGYYRKNTR